MATYTFKPLFFFLFICFALSCSTVKKLPAAQTTSGITSLNFLGEYIIPNGLSYNHTTVGGLSGIDYDAANDLYYMICDDRSVLNPARFYTAKISITQNGINSVDFVAVNNLLQPNGRVYPNSKQDPYHTPDPEAMRYNPLTGQLTWSSEGERAIKEKDTILADPSISVITKEGKFTDSFFIPKNLSMQATQKGPRQNSVFEGLSFAGNYSSLYVSVEEPLYEDGPRADVTDNNAYTRILEFDLKNKQNIKQVAYKLDPIAYPSTGYKINGVSDILSAGDNKLLVIERSFSTGRLACTVKVFLADLTGATDISNLELLKAGANFIPVKKKLILNMDSLGRYIDNIEGVSPGPVLPNGHKTLLFIADNNFNQIQKSQLLLFEIIE